MKAINPVLALLTITLFCAQPANADNDNGTTAVQTFGPASELHFETVLTIHGEVVSIDREHRIVTLKGPNGRKASLQAPEKDLRSVKPGDRVAVGYVEGVNVRKKKPGEVLPYASLKQGLIESEAGEIPKTGYRRQVAMVAYVQRVDEPNQEITLKGPDGSIETVLVEDPEILGLIKAGDQVVITLFEGLALSLEHD